MRIGLLTTSYPRYAGDVCGDFVAGFARALADRGHELDVLVPDAGAPFEQNACLAPSHPGIRRIAVRYAWPQDMQRLFYGAGVPENLAQAPWRLPQLLTFAGSLFRTAAKYAPRWDAVVSHWALPCGLVASALPTKVPHLAVCHSADVFALSALPLGRLLRRRLQQQAHALWFVAPALCDRFIVPDAPLPAMVHVCPMGFSPVLDDAAITSRVPRQTFRPLRAVTLSRLVPIKDVATAISAVREAVDVELMIAGDGPSRATLETEAAGCSRIRFLGTTVGANRARMLANADVFLLPSRQLPSGRSEGVPCALLEAMHAGLPVVASDVGGVSSVIQHEHNGLLVPQGDRHALQASIERLRDDPALRARLSAAARKTASAYTWSAITPRIEQLLHRH